jgi:hypothetical protein
MHAGVDVMQLCLTEVRDGPPDAGVDQREDLLADVGILSA